MQNALAGQDPKREVQVSTEMHRLSKAIAELDSLSENVEARLSGVLQPASTASAERSEKIAPPRPVLVPLAEQISTAHDGLKRISARIQDMLNRLEL